jgi:hypothetical protein
MSFFRRLLRESCLVNDETDISKGGGHSGFKSALAGVDCHGLSGVAKHEMLARLKRTHALTNPVYIGDTAHDERATQLANLTFIYVSWGFGKPEGKPHTVHSFSELVRYLSRVRLRDDVSAA